MSATATAATAASRAGVSNGAATGTHTTAAVAPTAAPATGGPVKVFGMPAPATPDQAKNDDQMLAWTLKHSTAAERRDIAADLGVSYPAAVATLGATCEKGHGYVAVWVINFSTKQAHWNVTLDGVGYAGASVLPQSLDYGAIGVPNGAHTIAFVNPDTGAVGAHMRTNLHCGTTAPVVTKPKPVVTKPKPVVTKPKPVVTKPKPVVTKPKPVVTKLKPVVTKPKPVVVTPGANPTHARGAVKPAMPRPVTSTHGTKGPKVQTDYVATATGTGVSPMLATVLLGAIAGSLVVARRFMRV